MTELSATDIDFILDEVITSGDSESYIYWKGQKYWYWFGPEETHDRHNVGSFELWLYETADSEEPFAKYPVSISAGGRIDG